MNNETTPKIYVACLATYNNGDYHGTWIDATQEADEMQKEIEEMLGASPMYPYAEDYAIHDYENFGGLRIGEYDSLKDIEMMANNLVNHGNIWAEYLNLFPDEVESFEDHYLGEYESFNDYVYQCLEDSGLIEAVEKAGLNPSYINIDAIANDWEDEGYHEIRKNGVSHIFQ